MMTAIKCSMRPLFWVLALLFPAIALAQPTVGVYLNMRSGLPNPHWVIESADDIQQLQGLVSGLPTTGPIGVPTFGAILLRSSGPATGLPASMVVTKGVIQIGAQTFDDIRGLDVFLIKNGREHGVCGGSDRRPTIVIGACDSGVGNRPDGEWCTISDRITICSRHSHNQHSQFEACVAELANDLETAGTITAQDRQAIEDCSAQAVTPAGVPITGKKLQLKDNADPTKRRVSASSKDVNVTLGDGNASADDPVVTPGSILRVLTANGCSGPCDTVYPLNDTWGYVGAPGQHKGYKYKSKTGVVRNVSIRNGKLLKLTARGGLGYELANPQTVHVLLQLGTGARFCMKFGGATKFKASTSGSTFQAKDAADPASCAP